MKLSEELITSRNNPQVKWAASLSSKKTRGEERAFVAEGFKLTAEALDAGLPISHIFVCEDKRREALALIADRINSPKFSDTEIIFVSRSAFEKISTEKSPEGIISVIKYLDFFRNADIIYKEEFFLEKDERALVLCSLRDPGNLGAVIRSATAFGVDHIVVTADSADIYNHKTVRAAMGSLFRTKVTSVSSLPSFIEAAQASGRRIFAAELTENAQSLSDLSIDSSDIFIIGNEGHGIPEDISSLCDGSVYIPISKKTESLNAAVAAAIFMWEQSK